MGYFKATARGVSWVGAFRMSTRAVAFVRTIVLARILSPAQFGVFGIASMVISFLEIITETGINIVLIQKKDNAEKYIDSAWVVSIFRGIFIGLILLGSASFVSDFFNSPESRNAIYLIALVPVIRGFINPSIVKMQKNLEFSKEFRFRFAIFAFDSAIAVILSIALQSALGIVWGLVAGAALELLMSFLFIRPLPKFKFDSTRVREVLSAGKWITGAGTFQFLFRQGDDAVVGRLLGEGQLGIYQVAYKISTLPISEITDVVARVTFPVYVKIADDVVRLKRAFIRTTLATAVLAAVLGLGLLLFGDFVVITFLGEKWLEIVPLLKVLVVFGVIQAFVNSTNSLLLALNKQKYATVVTLVGVLGLALSIVPLTTRYGLSGAVWSPLIGAVIATPVMLYLVHRAFREKHA